MAVTTARRLLDFWLRALLLVAIDGDEDDGEEVGELGEDSAKGFAVCSASRRVEEARML